MAKCVFFALFLLLTLDFGSTQDCPDPYIGIGNGNCYYFSNQDSLQLNWTAARSNCSSNISAPLDGDLIIIENNAEYLNITRYMANVYSEVESFWLGSSDIITEGFWRWIDDTSLSLFSGLWKENEPLTVDHDCLVLLNMREFVAGADHNRWRFAPQDCVVTQNFVCKIYLEEYGSFV